MVLTSLPVIGPLKKCDSGLHGPPSSPVPPSSPGTLFISSVQLLSWSYVRHTVAAVAAGRTASGGSLAGQVKWKAKEIEMERLFLS